MKDGLAETVTAHQRFMLPTDPVNMLLTSRCLYRDHISQILLKLAGAIKLVLSNEIMTEAMCVTALGLKSTVPSLSSLPYLQTGHRCPG